jgi:hypothetical protein
VVVGHIQSQCCIQLRQFVQLSTAQHAGHVTERVDHGVHLGRVQQSQVGGRVPQLGLRGDAFRLRAVDRLDQRDWVHSSLDRRA